MNFICFDFINSQWYKTHRNIDPFIDEGWITTFLSNWGYENLESPNEVEYKYLVELREDLININDDLLATNGIITEEMIKKINSYLTICKCYRILSKDNEGYKIEVKHENYSWFWIINEVATSFSEIILSKDISRVKICENPDCKFIYYDNSKNQSKRWCCDKCSNLIKVRRFRVKQKNEGS